MKFFRNLQERCVGLIMQINSAIYCEPFEHIKEIVVGKCQLLFLVLW